MPDKLLTLDEIRQRLGVSRTKFVRMVADGLFPGPLPIEGEMLWSEKCWKRYLYFAGRWKRQDFLPSRSRKKTGKSTGGQNP